MKRFKFFLFLAVVGLFTFDGARGQSVNCVFVYGTPSGTTGGATTGKQLLCVPSSIVGLIGPPGPAGPQGPPGPAGSGTTFTGGPCAQPASGVNLYAKLPDGSCLLIIAVPAANFIAANLINMRDDIFFKMTNFWKPLPGWRPWSTNGAYWPGPEETLRLNAGWYSPK